MSIFKKLPVHHGITKYTRATLQTNILNHQPLFTIKRLCEYHPMEFIRRLDLIWFWWQEACCDQLHQQQSILDYRHQYIIPIALWYLNLFFLWLLSGSLPDQHIAQNQHHECQIPSLNRGQESSFMLWRWSHYSVWYDFEQVIDLFVYTFKFTPTIFVYRSWAKWSRFAGCFSLSRWHCLQRRYGRERAKYFPQCRRRRYCSLVRSEGKKAMPNAAL